MRGGGGGLDRERGLFNLAKRISGSLSTSSSQDQELVGHFPIELLFLLCKFLSCEGCSLEFSPMGDRRRELGAKEMKQKGEKQGWSMCTWFPSFLLLSCSYQIHLHEFCK